MKHFLFTFYFFYSKQYTKHFNSDYVFKDPRNNSKTLPSTISYRNFKQRQKTFVPGFVKL